MADRFLAWVGAGVLVAGMSVAGVAGAATAVADDGADTETATASQSTAPPSGDSEPSPGRPVTDPDPAEAETEQPAAADEAAADTAGETVDEVEVEDTDDTNDPGDPGDDPGDLDDVDSAASGSGYRPAVDADQPIKAEVPTSTAVTDSSSVLADETPATDGVLPSPEPVAAEVEAPEPPDTIAEADSTAGQQPQPSTIHRAMTAADEQPAPKPTLLNVVGSFFWGLFDVVTKLVDSPPAVPPGSTLTAGRSKLEIDCGDGYTADADWYFPTEGEPDKFIYFQHGFPARAGFYNVTLRQLAERNNAIVVAPSITSNIFACDACASSGEPMHIAVARLFEGDRAALLASARAAGYSGTLPEQFVFAGQSAGASLAVAAAGFYYELAPEDEKSDMVGVLLYDVSALGGAAEGNALSNGLDRLPATVPVLNTAAEPNTLNSQSSANAIFMEKRPGQFNGVQLVGGAHSDAFQSDILFGIPQFIVNIAFGASTPENAEAVHVLTSGWLTDMYAGRVYDPATRTGIYGEPGDPGEVVVDIPTSAGLAQAYVLPALAPAPTFFDRLINGFFSLINVNYYARCAVDPGDTTRVASAADPQSCLRGRRSVTSV